MFRASQSAMSDPIELEWENEVKSNTAKTPTKYKITIKFGVNKNHKSIFKTDEQLGSFVRENVIKAMERMETDPSFNSRLYLAEKFGDSFLHFSDFGAEIMLPRSENSLR